MPFSKLLALNVFPHNLLYVATGRENLLSNSYGSKLLLKRNKVHSWVAYKFKQILTALSFGTDKSTLLVLANSVHFI